MHHKIHVSKQATIKICFPVDNKFWCNLLVSLGTFKIMMRANKRMVKKKLSQITNKGTSLTLQVGN